MLQIGDMVTPKYGRNSDRIFGIITSERVMNRQSNYWVNWIIGCEPSYEWVAPYDLKSAKDED